RPEDAAFLEELEEVEKENSNYKFIGTMTEMAGSNRVWRGETRFIDQEPRGIGFIQPSWRVMVNQMIKLKRPYEKPATDDGERSRVEGVGPRGLTKAQAKLDLWLKEIARSTELRKWFGDGPDKWVEFRQRYLKDLRQKADLIE